MSQSRTWKLICKDEQYVWAQTAEEREGFRIFASYRRLGNHPAAFQEHLQDDWRLHFASGLSEFVHLLVKVSVPLPKPYGSG